METENSGICCCCKGKYDITKMHFYSWLPYRMICSECLRSSRERHPIASRTNDYIRLFLSALRFLALFLAPVVIVKFLDAPILQLSIIVIWYLPLAIWVLRKRKQSKSIMKACPFKVGDTVFYKPSNKGQNLHPELLQVDKEYIVKDIQRNDYIVIEGFDHSEGGIYWSEFDSCNC